MARRPRAGHKRAKPDTGPGKGSVAALELAAGKSVVEAAAAAGVNERTVRRWLKGPAFRRTVEALRAEMIGEAVGRLTRGMTAAADKLVALLGSDDEGVQLRAAAAILQAGRQYRQDDELARRIAELKQMLEGEADGGAAGTS